MQYKKAGATLLILALIAVSYYLGTFHGASPNPESESPTSFSGPTVTSEESRIEESVTPPTAEPQGSPTAKAPVENPPEETLPSGTIRMSEIDQMEMVHIKAGEFLMGSADLDAQVAFNNGVAYPEVPIHTVTLDSYWIDRTEVTNSQYALCVEAGNCEPPRLNSDYIGRDYYPDPQYADYPVIYVSWYMATDYCEWAGRRLPTEAEWEKAARGTDARRYPWGNEPLTAERANFCDINCPKEHANPNFNDGFPIAAPVGSFPDGASPYGVFDMAGNVWEWTSSKPLPYPYDASDGREEEGGYQYIWRGGPWSNGTWWLRSSLRYRSVPHYWFNNLGFRCAVSDS